MKYTSSEENRAGKSYQLSEKAFNGIENGPGQEGHFHLLKRSLITGKEGLSLHALQDNRKVQILLTADLTASCHRMEREGERSIRLKLREKMSQLTEHSFFCWLILGLIIHNSFSPE